MKRVTVKLANGQTKVFIDEDVTWTNDDGYLKIQHGRTLVAEFVPNAWEWAELNDAPTTYEL